MRHDCTTSFGVECTGSGRVYGHSTLAPRRLSIPNFGGTVLSNYWSVHNRATFGQLPLTTAFQYRCHLLVIATLFPHGQIWAGRFQISMGKISTHPFSVNPDPFGPVLSPTVFPRSPLPYHTPLVRLPITVMLLYHVTVDLYTLQKSTLPFHLLITRQPLPTQRTESIPRGEGCNRVTLLYFTIHSIILFSLDFPSLLLLSP